MTKTLQDLETPAFIINRHTFVKNCSRALEVASKGGMGLRPHIKTHKTLEGAWLQATGGYSKFVMSRYKHVSGFIASTLPEVELLIQGATLYGGPFSDILYGVPISQSKLARLDALREKLPEGGKINILIDHEQQVAMVENLFEKAKTSPAHQKALKRKLDLDLNLDCPPETKVWSVFLKLDTGYHRAGITCDDRGVQLALKVIDSPLLELAGVYSHWYVQRGFSFLLLAVMRNLAYSFSYIFFFTLDCCTSGHAYDVNNTKELDKIAESDLQHIQTFLELLKNQRPEAVEKLIVSVGSTPSMSHHSNGHDGLKQLSTVEIHAGNYTLYDRQQMWTGACGGEDDVAGRVLARVIGHYEDRNTILLDAGATALTKEQTPQGGMCQLVGFPDLECYKMSQEVTIVRHKDPKAAFPFSQLPLGSLVTLLPNHSCLAAACFGKYYVIQDSSCSFSPEQKVVEEWIPAKFF
jgi:D-serine deaminase-like pyridoxal phosphate-dependent protein